MSALIIQHMIKDYALWRPVFDEHETIRVEASIVNPRVYRGADDPNDIVMIFDVGDLDTAEEFIDSDNLRMVMKDAGVVGNPVVHLISDDD